MSHPFPIGDAEFNPWDAPAGPAAQPEAPPSDSAGDLPDAATSVAQLESSVAQLDVSEAKPSPELPDSPPWGPTSPQQVTPKDQPESTEDAWQTVEALGTPAETPVTLSTHDLDILASATPAGGPERTIDTRATAEFDPFATGTRPTNLMTQQTRRPSAVFGHEEAAAAADASAFGRVLNGVFVVRFDTTRGNIIEFQHPPDLPLAGIEFTTLPSGSHSIGMDVIYFRLPPYFGLSVFKRTVVLASGDADASGKSAEIARSERGARVRSIGIITRSFHELHRHVVFLQAQVDMHILAPIATLSDSLLAYFHIVNDGGSLPPELLGPPGGEAPLVENPLSYLPEFVHRLGARVFSVWKLALLKQRVLFFTAPPVQESCLDVYCASLLTNHDVPHFALRGFEPLFFVNINDMALLERFRVPPGVGLRLENNGYVACTSDALFRSRPELWDALVVDHKIQFSPSAASNQTRLRFGVDSARRYAAYVTNAADESKYEFLRALIRRHTARAESAATGVATGDGIKGWLASLTGSRRLAQNSAAQHLRDAEESEMLLMDAEDSVAERWNYVSRPAAPSGDRPQLSPIESELAHGAEDSLTYRAALAILSYFHHLTTKLLSTILMLCHSPGDAVLYSWDLYNLDLDPFSGGDRQFLLDLAELYGLSLRIPLLDEERRLIEEGRLQDGWETMGQDDHALGSAAPAAASASGIRGTRGGGIYGGGMGGRWVGRNMAVMMREWEGFVGPRGLGIGAPGRGLGAVGLAAVGSVINAFKPLPPP